MSDSASSHSSESDASSSFEGSHDHSDASTFDENQEGPKLVKNQHFDEAIDLSMSTEFSSPEKEPFTHMKEGDVQNQKFDDALEISNLSEGIDSTNSPTRNSRAANDAFANEDFQENEIFDKKLVNDRYDAAIEIENGEDESSVETQPSLLGNSPKRQVVMEKQHIIPTHTSTFPENRQMMSGEERDMLQTDDASTDSSESTSEESGDEDEEGTFSVARAYRPSDYADLDVSEEIKDLFQYIHRYKPQEVELDTSLKCFIPAYIPAIGEMDAFLKVPRPDGKPDGLGTTVLDEPAATQSDAAVLELQLRAMSKKRHGDVMVRSIENAVKNPQEIERWIKSIDELHRSKPPPQVHYKKNMPSIEKLMEPWPEHFEAAISDGNVKLPDVNLDLSIEEYAKVLCSILDIPVYEGNIIESVHLMFTLFLEFEANQHFSSGDMTSDAPAPDGLEGIGNGRLSPYNFTQ